LPPRPTDAHKGDFGRVLVVGGSRGMIGAVALAANAALRGGAGLVAFAAPQTVQLTIAGLCPCATSAPLAADETGQLLPEAAKQLALLAEDCNVLAMGPGLRVGQPQQALVADALVYGKPVVLDADGLNNLARHEQWAVGRVGPLVLTPHPGEFAELTGLPVADFQQRRRDVAVEAVQRWKEGADKKAGELVCVLKGAGTVVTDGQRVYVNETGNPGMATGGSGDVLTGLIAALISQGMTVFDAACLGVRLHGRAGDLAAERLGQASLIATDLLDYLPAAMQEHPE